MNMQTSCRKLMNYRYNHPFIFFINSFIINYRYILPSIIPFIHSSFYSSFLIFIHVFIHSFVYSSFHFIQYVNQVHTFNWLNFFIPLFLFHCQFILLVYIYIFIFIIHSFLLFPILKINLKKYYLFMKKSKKFK